MTNERWRAEMPKWWHRDVDAIVTRANAELDAAEAEKAALTKERDELKATIGQLEAKVIQFEHDSERLPDYIRGNDELRRRETRQLKRISALKSELAARRASDPDVRECAESIQFYRPGALEAANRLLAADWLKKEGGL